MTMSISTPSAPQEGPGRSDEFAFPPELARPFWIIALGWDGTAIAHRHEDAWLLGRDAEALLSLGVCLAVITGADFPTIDRQLSGAIHGAPKRHLYVLTDHGSEVYGFDRRSRPILLRRRSATATEEHVLTAIAEAACDRLRAQTGLEIRIVGDRPNRRTLDLLPPLEGQDAPQSDREALFQTAERRLTGAGLRGGVREAVRLVAQIARDFGLMQARIASDGQHIEVGLTDDAEAIRWVMEELAGRRNLPRERVLIVGSEFGSSGEIKGRHAALLSSHSRGAVIVSVGPEPWGVPSGVVHLGGGSSRFRALLQAQISVHRGRWPPPRAIAVELPARLSGDPAWLLIEEGIALAREREIESLFTVANGYLGSRGALEEGSSRSAPATLVAGVFGLPATPDAVPELVPVPEWTYLRLEVGGRALTLETAETLEHRRILDVRQGLLWREWRYRDAAGRITRLRSLRLASLDDRHLLVQSVTMTAENYSGRVRLESGFRQTSSLVEPSQSELADVPEGVLSDALRLEVRAVGTGTTVALAASNRLYTDGSAPLTPEMAPARGGLVHQYQLEADIGQTWRLDRLVSVYSSRDVARPAEAASARLGRLLAGGGVGAAIDAHRRAWEARWQGADVHVEGDPEAQRALRFALYHLISAANPEDERVSVGARALTGRVYKGHVFWDTEIYLLPFYIFTYPPTARALLMYRYHTLPAARKKARDLGYRGALYAWESAADGRETTPTVILTPAGDTVRILTGEQEHHISADIAYAVWHYWQATGDDEFFLNAGAEILLETARFWAARGQLGPDGRYHITRVIGPDEYHEGVDDNAYTNVMAQWNLERAAEAVRLLQERWPRRAMEILARLEVEPGEPERWLSVAQHLYTGFDPRTGLFEQFRGYFDLEPIDLAAYEPRTAPMDVLLGRPRTQQSQVIKQADVVMLLALLWERFPPSVREANFRYYEPRTAHGSSLSPAVHALVAARLGDVALAGRYFHQGASIDLTHHMGNAAGGVHIAALGGLWQAAVLGYAGMTLRPDGLAFAPNLPHTWRQLRFPMRWRGRALTVTLSQEPRALVVELTGPGPMTVAVPGGPRVTAVPGHRYRVCWEADGWEAWQEVRYAGPEAPSQERRCP
jgi:trehalose/maltose hydrolase-like predicted phosphorylase